VGVEGDDLGVGCAEFGDGAAGDGADRAEVLGQDQVRLQCLEELAVDRIERESVADRLAYGLVDLDAGQPRRVDTRGGYDR
jgi:hypothetical protein